MDNNELLMIILAFIVGYMCSGMMKQMCGSRLVEGVEGVKYTAKPFDDIFRDSNLDDQVKKITYDGIIYICENYDENYENMVDYQRFCEPISN